MSGSIAVDGHPMVREGLLLREFEKHIHSEQIWFSSPTFSVMANEKKNNYLS